MLQIRSLVLRNKITELGSLISLLTQLPIPMTTKHISTLLLHFSGKLSFLLLLILFLVTKCSLCRWKPSETTSQTGALPFSLPHASRPISCVSAPGYTRLLSIPETWLPPYCFKIFKHTVVSFSKSSLSSFLI